MKSFKFYVYVLVYVMDYGVMNTEMVESNVYVLVDSEWESETDDITEQNYRIAGKLGGGKIWRFDWFRAFSKRTFGELIDQPIDY